MKFTISAEWKIQELYHRDYQVSASVTHQQKSVNSAILDASCSPNIDSTGKILQQIQMQSGHIWITDVTSLILVTYDK